MKFYLVVIFKIIGHLTDLANKKFNIQISIPVDKQFLFRNLPVRNIKTVIY